MKIQFKVLTMHALTSLLNTYVTTRERKAPINKLSRSKAPKSQQVESVMRLRVFLAATDRDGTIAPVTTLLI